MSDIQTAADEALDLLRRRQAELEAEAAGHAAKAAEATRAADVLRDLIAALARKTKPRKVRPAEVCQSEPSAPVTFNGLGEVADV